MHKLEKETMARHDCLLSIVYCLLPNTKVVSPGNIRAPHQKQRPLGMIEQFFLLGLARS